MVVLDTHAMLWWAAGEHDRLSNLALDAIQRHMPGGGLLVSSISAWELAVLVQKGRISLAVDVSTWLSTFSRIEGIEIVPVDAEIAVNSAQLPGDFHKDPADRMIVATARKWGVPVVTADEKIRSYAHVATIW